MPRTSPAGAPGLTVRAAAGPTRAVVLVLYGGRVSSHAPSRRWHLSALRMVPFARSLHRTGREHGIAVWTVRYRYRGWNGAEESPAHDARWALDEVRRQHGDVPVALVGHSMGGRTALRVGDDPSVTTIVALAPWLPPDEPVSDLRGRSILILHGTLDRWTDPKASLALAEELASVTSVRRVAIKGDAHSMLRRAALWQGLTAQFVEDEIRKSVEDEIRKSVEDEIRKSVEDEIRTSGTDDLDERNDQTPRTVGPNHPYRLPAEGVHLQM